MPSGLPDFVYTKAVRFKISRINHVWQRSSSRIPYIISSPHITVRLYIYIQLFTAFTWERNRTPSSQTLENHSASPRCRSAYRYSILTHELPAPVLLADSMPHSV